jgi:kexin
LKIRLGIAASIATACFAGCGGGASSSAPSSSAAPVPTYTVGGAIAGLTGSGIVLQLNGGGNLPIGANATAFTFTPQLASGAAYTASVLTQPTNPSQTCTVTNGSGTVASANVTNISISCATRSFTVGGTVSGLMGSGLVLQNNGGNNLPIGGNGAFTFSTPIVSGATYAVTVSTQPSASAQTCTVTSGSGTVGSANVTNVGVTCITPVPDPLYTDQWHLKNTGQLGATSVAGTVGEDMNVEPVWLATTPRKGTGVRIAVVDDGLEIGHEDLVSNIATGLSYNYLNGGSDPTGGAHGTSVAGIAASRDLNGLGGRGAAPRANMVGYNLLQSSISANEADAMTRGSSNVHISTNSWGAPDGQGTLDASTSLWRTAIASGLTSGRNGLGTIYTWAAGNGATGSQACPTCVDNSNYDGRANNRGVIAVAAVNDRGIKASYSESGANLWVSAPGGEFCDTHTITTTDRTGGVDGFNTTATAGVSDYANTNYTKCMNGTSSATPGAAGVIALMLEAKPTLGWRDVRLIVAQSARKNDPTDAGWTLSTTTPAYNFNHKYGFGVVDAQAAVTLASTWTNVGPELSFTTALASPGLAIPDNNAVGVSNTINVGGSGIANIEFIEITFSAADHTFSGDLAITLTSPAGTVSQLSTAHNCAPCTAYSGWVFGSARHLGEAANGSWMLIVRDLAPVDTGTFQSWRLKFYGR